MNNIFYSKGIIFLLLIMFNRISIILLSLLLLTSCTEEKLLLNECKDLIVNEMKDPDSVVIIDSNNSNEYWFKTISWDYKATNSYWAHVRSYFFCYKWDDKMILKLSETPITKLSQSISNEEIDILLKK